MSELTKKKCEPCEGGVPPMPDDKAEEMLKQTPDWEKEGKKIQREFKFKDFVEAMKFVNKVADLAESEDHHPDIHIYWNKVQLVLWTHAIDGLSENDFIVAAKVNEINM